MMGLFLGLMLSLSAADFAFAQGTILPDLREEGTGNVVENCKELIDGFNKSMAVNGEEVPIVPEDIPQILGCAIQTGRVSLAMIPYFLQYFSNYFLGIVSLIALLFVVIGGFMYTTGGVSEQKDTGKSYIVNALIGMSVAFLAWTIVNVILAVVTR